MFVTCFLYGGLGNQLFQIYTTISYSMRHKIPFKFIYTENLGKRPVYWGTFLKGLSNYLSTDIDIETLTKIKQNGLLLEAPNNNSVILDGYFQSFHFFKDFYNEISQLTGIEQHKTDIYKQFYANYKDNNCISMHFRRGDYKGLQHIHPIMNIEYYANALSYITTVSQKDKYNIIYFCEDEDADDIKKTDIETLEIYFPNCDFRRFVGLSDWEEMIYMSCCDHHIIANSSFSWWGAYLHNRSQPSVNIVCYPDKWFGNNIQFPTDLCPNEWTKVSI